MEGEGDRLRYRSAGGGSVLLEDRVHVRGEDPEGSVAEGIGRWRLETPWLLYVPSGGKVRTRAFRLESDQGVLGGEQLLLDLEGEEGRVQHLLATGAASLRIPLQGDGGPPATRVITGDEIEMEPAEEGGGPPRRLLARGGARLERQGGDPDTVQDLRGEEIEWLGAAGGEEGAGGGRLEARGEASLLLGSAAEPALLTGSVLEAEMDREGEVRGGRASAPVRYEGPEGTARARRAVLEDGGERIVLQQGPGGLAALDLPEGRITGSRIDLWRERGEMVAEGDVRTLHTGDDGGEGLFGGDEPVHGTADRVRAFRDQGRIRYEGAARLWQEGDLLQADEVEIRREEGTLEAWGRVSSRSLVPPEDAEAAPRPVAGTADHLHYHDGERRAVYTGGAHLEWGEDQVDADQVELFLDDDGKVERLLAHGAVEMRSPGRRASGEHLDYRAGAEQAILRGGERLATAQNLENQQVVRGETLTFDLAGGTLVVESGPGGRTWITLSPGGKSPRPVEAAQESRERATSGEGSLGTSPGH
jgi:lipopolysaccharide transport protein LptA